MQLGSVFDFLETDPHESSVIQNNYIMSSIVLSYVLFCKLVGPMMMKNRKPMKLQRVILMYNLSLVVINACLAYLITKRTIEEWPYRCNLQVSNPRTSSYKELAKFKWLVLFVKFTELLDTVFFVLRKKFQQVSFLHVYHHTLVAGLYWWFLKQKTFGYYMALMGSINLSIHVVMYLYYGLAALGPEVRRFLWWKKYLSLLQILQLFVIFGYMSVSFLTGCAEYGFYEKIAFWGTGIFMALFFNFYFKTYKSNVHKQEVLNLDKVKK